MLVDGLGLTRNLASMEGEGVPSAPLKGVMLPPVSFHCSGKGSSSHLFALHRGPQDIPKTGVVFTPPLNPISLA